VVNRFWPRKSKSQKRITTRTRAAGTSPEAAENQKEDTENSNEFGAFRAIEFARAQARRNLR